MSAKRSVYLLTYIFQAILMSKRFAKWTVHSQMLFLVDNVPERKRAPDQCPWPSRFPWLWPGPRAGLSFDLTPDQQQQPVHVPFNITPFTRRGPGLVPDQVGRVGRHAAAMPARRAGPVHCMRAKVTHWFGLLPSSGTIFEGCLLVGSCFNILSTGQHSATWTSPLYARKRATPPNVATAAPAKSTNYTSWKFVVPRKFCFVGLVCFTIIHFASSRVHCMRIMGYLLLLFW